MTNLQNTHSDISPLITAIENFTPYNEQETLEKEELLRHLRSGAKLFTRENASVHFTASAWIISPDHTKVLMAHHNLYNSWAWLGGHADGETDLLKVAIKEVREESGLSEFKIVSPEIYSLEILPVFGHEKRGTYVPTHLHLNVTFLFEADPAAPVCCKLDENSRIGWFSLEDGVNASSEPWMRERVYKKLNAKLKNFI